MKLIVTFLFSLLVFSRQATGQVVLLSGEKIENTLIDKFIAEQMSTLNIKGLSIAFITNGSLSYHKTFGVSNIYTEEKVSKSTSFEAASLAKPMFAFFVMTLVKKKVLDLDTPLFNYLPYQDFENDQRYKQITARMVLSHTTGLPNWRGNEPLKLKFQPGTDFSYSGEAYMYLARVIAHLTDHTPQNLDQLFQKEVASPLKLRNTHFAINRFVAKKLASAHKGDRLVYDSSWDRKVFDPAGGLYSDARDYARFLSALMKESSQQTADINEMFKEQVKLSENDPRRATGITGWGLGFSIKPTAQGINYMHGGNNLGYTSFFMINPGKKIGVVVLTNTDQCNSLKQNIENFLTGLSI